MDYTAEQKQIDEWRSQLEKLMITDTFTINYYEKNGLRVELEYNILVFRTPYDNVIFLTYMPTNIHDYVEYKDTVNDIIEDLKIISNNMHKVFDEVQGKNLKINVCLENNGRY